MRPSKLVAGFPLDGPIILLKGFPFVTWQALVAHFPTRGLLPHHCFTYPRRASFHLIAKVISAALRNNTGRAYPAKYSDAQRGPRQTFFAISAKPFQTSACGLPELCRARRRFLGHGFR
jgi:hypothetical protein